MKDCYKVAKIVNVCGTLDVNEEDELFIVVQNKEDELVVPFSELVTSLIGQKISIKSEEYESI